MNQRGRCVRHASELPLQVLFDDIAALLECEVIKVKELAYSVAVLLNEPHLLALGPAATARIEQGHIVAGEDELCACCVYLRVIEPVDDEAGKLRMKA